MGLWINYSQIEPCLRMIRLSALIRHAVGGGDCRGSHWLIRICVWGSSQDEESNATAESTTNNKEE